MKWFEKLQFARKVKKLSIRSVAKKVGFSNAYLCQLENGQIAEPSYFKITRLLNLYNLSHKDLVEK